jgi:hypothetical protein
MTAIRTLILRANALYIGVAGAAGVLFDLRGIYLGAGPQGRILADAPYAGIGFLEAHGLAVILAVLLWRAAPARMWHLTAMLIDVLLGTSNLLLWQIFVAADVLAVGYVTTILHWTFAALQLLATFSLRGATLAYCKRAVTQA